MQLVLRPQALQSSSVQTSAVLGACALTAGTAVALLHGANPVTALCRHVPAPQELGHCLSAALLFPGGLCTTRHPQLKVHFPGVQD